jgi:hypothetical protein
MAQANAALLQQAGGQGVIVIMHGTGVADDGIDVSSRLMRCEFTLLMAGHEKMYILYWKGVLCCCDIICKYGR